jgi:hypothetical protein
MAKHPNPRYFVLKSIMLNNLYGVDIMEEATEICKLRLFLKLVSQVEAAPKKANFGLEPLPDIDFNIRAGNTLVGFASIEQAFESIAKEASGQGKLIFDDGTLNRIMRSAIEAAQEFKRFKSLQVEDHVDGAEVVFSKRLLKAALAELREELDRYLAEEYERGLSKKEDKFQKWLTSHHPFHWFVEFYSIINGGGFDVIIGNPPWKEYAAVKKSQYTLMNFHSEKCGNLYAMCTERVLQLSAPSGWTSFIVQLPLVSSSRMVILREILRQHSQYLLTIPFDDRPGKLFKDLEHCRSSIFIAEAGKASNNKRLIASRYQRWASQVRDYLFYQVEFAEIVGKLIYADQFPKYANRIQEALFSKITANSKNTIRCLTSQQKSESFIFYQEAIQYWAKATIRLPHYAKNGRIDAPAHGRYLYFESATVANIVCALLNSSLFYAYFIAYGDCFHLSDKLASGFPIIDNLIHDQKLVNLNHQLMEDLKVNAENKTIKTKDGDLIEYEEFSASQSKHIIDEIDRILAQHYGFTDEELDFIINYDIKYRMGRDSGADD